MVIITELSGVMKGLARPIATKTKANDERISTNLLLFDNSTADLLISFLL